MKKIAIVLGLIIVIGGLLGFVSILPIWDDAAVHDSDLLLEPLPVLAEEDNAYYALPDLTNLSPEVQKELDTILTKWRTIENKQDLTTKLPSASELQHFVAATAALVEQYSKASARKGYGCPGQANEVIASCGLTVVRDLGTVAAIHAYYFATVGNNQMAEQLLLTNTRMAALLTSSEHAESLIQYLVGVSIFNSFIEVPKLREVLSPEAKRTIAASVPDLTTVNIVLRRQYMDDKETFILPAVTPQGKNQATYWIRTHNTLNLYADITRKQLAVVATPCDTQPEIDDLERAFEAVHDPAKWWYKGNFMGRMLVSIITVSSVSLRESACHLQTVASIQ